MQHHELFQSLRNVSDHKPIANDRKRSLIKHGFIREVFGGALMLTKDGRDRLDNINRIAQTEKDQGRF
jgi:hypothetical protein